MCKKLLKHFYGDQFSLSNKAHHILLGIGVTVLSSSFKLMFYGSFMTSCFQSFLVLFWVFFVTLWKEPWPYLNHCFHRQLPSWCSTHRFWAGLWARVVMSLVCLLWQCYSALFHMSGAPGTPAQCLLVPPAETEVTSTSVWLSIGIYWRQDNKANGPVYPATV